MSNFEMRTPLLKKATDVMSSLLDDLAEGAVEHNTAARMIGATNALTRGVATELNVRLKAPMIAKADAAQAKMAAA